MEFHCWLYKYEKQYKSKKDCEYWRKYVEDRLMEAKRLIDDLDSKYDSKEY